jgi:2-methylisocitrate lyase-like PEP mutase family enzyme
MMGAMSARILEFRRLHESGCFVIPNPWDRGSAVYLQSLGFKALATTSAGMAWSLGRPDNAVTLEQVLPHLEEIAGAVAVPVNADFEGGFAVEPEGVAANVARAVRTGIAGLSIEDSTGDAHEPLIELALAVERIKAARGAIDRSGSGVLLTGRSEGFFVGRPDLRETVKRLQAYAAAGADVLYAPGIRSPAEIAAVVKAVAPKPVNLLMSGNWMTVAQAAALGVRRISTGGALARTAWSAFTQAAKEIAESGSFAGLGPPATAAQLNQAFRATARRRET